MFVVQKEQRTSRTKGKKKKETRGTLLDQVVNLVRFFQNWVNDKQRTGRFLSKARDLWNEGNLIKMCAGLQQRWNKLQNEI